MFCVFCCEVLPDKTVCNEAVAAETSGDTRDEVNNKSGMGFEARKCDWGDVRDDALSSDRHRGYTCAGVSECGAYSLLWEGRKSTKGRKEDY